MAVSTLTTYGRYKTMQDDFANFLGQTGRLCKAPSHLLKEPEDPQPEGPPSASNIGDSRVAQGRLKGKARKLAKENANTSEGIKPAARKTYILQLKNYIPLAQHVSDSKSVHSAIPTWVISTLTSIIRDRQDKLNHYKGDGMSHMVSGFEQLQQDNEKHEHMINVLRRVRVILGEKHTVQQEHQAAKSARIAHERSKSQRHTSGTSFPQQFNLDNHDAEDSCTEYRVEEQIEDTDLEGQREAAATAWKTKTIAKADVRFEADIDVSFPDALQALGDLCKEWQVMRTQVKQAWKGYADGSVDLGAVAIMANTAIDLARHLEEGVRPLVARNDEICRKGIWKDTTSVLNSPVDPWKNVYSGLYHCLFTGAIVDLNAASKAASSATSPWTYTSLPRRQKADAAECLEFWFIQSFQALETKHKLSSSISSLGREVPKSDYHLKCPYGVTEAEFRVASEDMAELAFVGRYTKDLFLNFVDEVTRAMCIVSVEPDFSLWTVFAWQLFRDAEELLGEQHMSKAFNELQEFATAGDELLCEIIALGEDRLHCYAHPKDLDALLHEVLAKISTMRVDWVEVVGKTHGLIPTAPWNKQSKPFRLLRRHPIFCGLALESSRLWMQAVGNTLVNGGIQVVMTMAHLYNLCKVDAEAKGGEVWNAWAAAGPWEDLERLVISLQPENVFIGGQAPTTREDCCKNFALVKGLPMSFLNPFLAGQSGPVGSTLEECIRDFRRRIRTTVRRKALNFVGDFYPVSDNFAARFANHDNRRDLTIQNLSQILEKGRMKKDSRRPRRRKTTSACQAQPSALLLDLLTQLDQEASVLKASSPRLFLDCLNLLRDVDAQLAAHINLTELFDGLKTMQKRATDNHGFRQLPGFRVVVVLTGTYNECLPIVRKVLIQWLKSNGGNGTVSFPKPPSKKAD